MAASTAYTTVHTNRAFKPPITTSKVLPAVSQSATPASNGKVEWPQGVREYVQRAFAAENCVDHVPRQEMEVKLKQVISDAVRGGVLNSLDWSKALLPQQIIIEERKQREETRANAPWIGARDVPVHHSTNEKATSSPRKRKSSDLDPAHESATKIPPWQIQRNLFESRLSMPDKSTKLDASHVHEGQLQKRRQKFDRNGHDPFSKRINHVHRLPSPEHSLEPVVGQCQNLEKKYFRLTSAPKPDTVRPLHILEQAVEFLKRKWRSERNYSYMCDQLKSIRQDLTVQHIRSAFTVSVYELHARIALEKGDLGEYNQCQTQLRALYTQKLGGHPQEFLAYRILYFIHTCNRTDMNDVFAELTPTEKAHPAVKHALQARSALALGNYRRFFQLYLETPNMGAYLMDMFVGRERLVALSNICISYKPDVKLRFVTEELGFESDDESARFICDHSGQSFLDTGADGEVRLLTGKALRFFDSAKAAAFKTIDIKGQI